jgi:type I restriction enzyme S subunit
LREGWKNVPLSDIAALNPEAIRRKSPPSEIDYIDISAVSSTGVDPGAIKRMAYSDAPSRAQRIVRAGDVIISTVRPYLRGRALIGGEFDGFVVSTGFCVVRPGPECLPRFLDAATTTDAFYEHLESRQTGSAYPAVRPSDVGDALISLPPLEEQQRIADLLASIERARSAAIQHAEALGGLQASVLAALVSGAHSIPSAYDRLIGDGNSAITHLDRATV